MIRHLLREVTESGLQACFFLKHTLRIINKYRQVLKEQGWKGLVKEAGWQAAVLLFLFFLIKGIGWLVVIYFGAKTVAG